MNLLRLFFVITATSSFSAAATLSGIVMDPDGRAVPSARVEIYAVPAGARLVSTSDDTGTYRLSGIPAGEYLLEVSASGFRVFGDRIQLTAGDVKRDVRLGLDRVSAEVVVTAMDSPQRANEVARALDVIGSEQITLTGKNSLGDVLQGVPGLRVQSLGGPGAFTRVLSRGLRAQDTAVTVDGLRFRDAATTQGDATTFLENLFVSNVSRVEVMRGAGSAVYGSHAIGGVVNVVTDTGGGPLHGEIQAEGGGLGLARGMFRIAGGQKLGFSAGLQHLNVRNGLDGYDPFRNTTLQGAAQTRITPATTLFLRIWGGDGLSLLNDSPYAAPASQLPPSGPIVAVPVTREIQDLIEAGQTPSLGGANLVPNLNDPDSRRASRFYAAAASLVHQLGSRANLRASYQRVSTRRIFEDGPAGVRFEPLFRTVSLIEGGIDTVQVRADASTRFGTSFGGYEWERETYWGPYEDFNPDPARRENYTASARQRSHALLGTHQFRMLQEKLQVSLSGRYQRFALSQPQFGGATPVYSGGDFPTPPTAATGDVAVVYFAAQTGTKLRAHAGNGYRAPSIYERFGVTFFEGQFTALGDPRLEPDRSAAFDWGVDQYLFRERVRLSATHFYTELRQVIAFDSSGLLNPATDPYGRSSGYRNTSGGIARGAELGAEVSLMRGSTVRAAYTFTNSGQRVSTVRDNDFFRAPFIARHTGSVTWLQRISRRWDAAFDFWIASDHPQVYSRRAFLFPGARKADVAVHYTLPVTDRWKARAFVKVNNVFDVEYLENGFRTPGAWGTGGISFSF